jgi:phosphoribosylaminoimidazole-succinocarboxamide synthase
MQIVTSTDIKEYPLLARGKVRDIYEISEDTLLLVTTDRMSAFDVIMAEPVPYKGVVLNQITLFWMERFKNIIANHVIESDVNNYPAPLQPYREQLEGRSVLARKAKPVMMECVVRGYLSGSGWKDYLQTGTVCGFAVPAGTLESSRLPTPFFTPATKADLGEHDINLTEAEARKHSGDALYEQLRDISLAMFNNASAYASSSDIIIADTKFEFGHVNGELILIDEVLTPDSSRFWNRHQYMPGKGQPSFDKQYLRDWLEQQVWDKTPPSPALPKEVVERTAQKYFGAYKLLTGKTLTVGPM